MTARAVLLSSSYTVQSLRRSPLVVHLAEKGVLTLDAPVLGCGQTKSVSRFSFVWSSPLSHILGGTIPAIKFKSSTLVGFRQPVIDRHAWFRTGFSLLRVLISPRMVQRIRQ